MMQMSCGMFSELVLSVLRFGANVCGHSIIYEFVFVCSSERTMTVFEEKSLGSMLSTIIMALSHCEYRIYHGLLLIGYLVSLF